MIYGNTQKKWEMAQKFHIFQWAAIPTEEQQ